MEPKDPWQPEDTRHKDIQVVNTPDDHDGLLPMGYIGSGDMELRYTNQARGEPIVQAASPTMSTPPQSRMRIPSSPAEMPSTPNIDRPRAPSFIPADYVKLRKPWEEEMRKGTPSYAAMEIKVRELEDNSMFLRKPTEITKTVSRAFKCEWCGKSFSRAGGLPRHQSSCASRPYHLRTSLFTCLECGETRPRKDKMQLHCQRKHGQEWGNARFMETTKEQVRDKDMTTFSTEGNIAQACPDESKPCSQIRSPQHVEPASSWGKGSQTPDSTGVQLEWNDVLGFSSNPLDPIRPSEIESYLPENTLRDQVPGDLSRLSIDESVLPNFRPLVLESVISSDDGAHVSDADEDYFAIAETYSRPVDSESHMSFHNNSTFSIPLRTIDEQHKPTTTQDAFKPGLTKPEQVGTIDMSYADSESDMSIQRTSIFSGHPESAHEQSTLPTTHDNEPGLQKLEQPVTTDMSCADSIQSDGCALGLDATAKVKLSSELASMIFAELGVDNVPGDLTSSIINLLYDCAAVLQRRVRGDDIGHRVAIFMRHRRNMIARQLSLEKAHERAPGLAMDFREKISFLMSKQGVQGLPDDIDLSNVEDLTDEDGMKQPDVQEARAFLAGSAEFAWLLVRLKALCQLQVTGETYTSVRQTICRSLEHGRRGYSFSLNWCPLAFMTTQYPSGAKLSQVICVSGDATRAQAATCEQYLAQTWPYIGPAVLKCLDKYIESGTSSLCTGSAEQNLELHIQRLPNDSTCIRVVADPNVVLEIGEVLAWLVVACRTGDLKEAVAPTSVLSSPRVSSSLDGNFEISWTSEPLAQSSYLSEETCWHDLFNSCSIAQGYPVPRRTHNEPGLELSLGLMSMLGAASRAVLFDSVLFLKGLCSMFVPLQKVGASVVWHYLVHRDEYGNFSDWMPHYEASHGREPLRSLDFSDLVDCPQYVGWSRETKMVAGSKDARYDEVDFGGKPIKPGFALDGVSISISKVLSVGTKAVAGKKDTPMFQCASGPYEQTINITAKWTALMYDTAERRGWLLDGATALLHMCRAAMTHPDAPEIGRDLPKSPVDSFTYAGGGTDAKDILLDKQNRELIIYDDKEKPWTFEDLVLQHWSTFEEMKSHHFKLRSRETKQWEVSNPLSKRLEGFGFVDILTREPCMPRYHPLSSQASRWLQFTTQCGAINILGSGFGDLIAPLTSCKKTLEALPCGHDLIAAPVGLLHRIARRIGLVSASSIELCDGVYWNDPSRSFASDPCQCIESPQKDLMWRCGGGITSLEGRAGDNNCKRRRLVEMISDYSRGAIILGGRSSRFDDRLCAESSEAQVPVSPQSGKRRAVDEGYSSSRS